jgi:hypothetical protein
MGHVMHVADRMREADKAEAWAACRWTPLFAADFSVRCSTVAITALLEGEPVGLFGVTPVDTLAGVGAPWAFATDRVMQLRREWLTDAPQWLMLLGDGYFLLRNHVDARNTLARHWLARVGFRIGPAEPYGVAGLPFHPFERRA